jgi:hypothetical protein
MTAAGRRVAEHVPELDAARDDAYLVGIHVEEAELGPNAQLAALRDDEEVAICTVDLSCLSE